MFHRVTCPSCQHKFTIPEGDVGKLANCPNCQSPFRAGKSVADAEVPMKMQIPAPAPVGINKTMLGETEPPIKYNCPRCKKPLESPSIEAGTKKPCPACGQRLQVPAAPRPVAPPQPAINKTMLAVDESIQPVQQMSMPAPPPIPTAPSKKRADPDERSQPSAGGRGVSMVTLVGGGIFALSLLACVGVLFVSGRGPTPEQIEARRKYDETQKELDALKQSIQQNALLMAQQKMFESEKQKWYNDKLEELKAQQRKLDYEREQDQRNAALANDQKAAAEAKEKRRREQEDIDRIAKQSLADKERADMEVKNKLASLQAQLDAANQKAQQATIIVSQPPPPPYYPPYHWRNYWGY